MQKKNILLSVVGIFAFAVMFSACQSTSTPVTTEPAPVEQVAPSATDPDEQTMNEQDDEDSEVDSVTTTATYESPAGPEQVGFTLMVDDEGVITDAKIEMLAKAPISKARQEAFAKEFPTALKGKKLAELTQIDRLGGSSLTTGAFNKALEELKAQL